MLRAFLRLVLTLALLASATLTGLSVWQIWQDPALHPIRVATTEEIAARVDSLLARHANAGSIAERLATRLAEAPRNWVAIDALTDLAAERGIALPPALSDQVAQARAEDFSAMTILSDCAACMMDIAKCSLNTALVCKAPILLTPVEDIRSVLQAAADYTTGHEIDQIDLGLSVLGLSATALALPSGGSTLSFKAGAATVKLARGLGRMSPRLTQLSADALKTGIDWAALPGVRGLDDLTGLLRSDALRPLAQTLSDLGRTAETIGPAATLHLLPLIDDAPDAARLARISEALGPRTLGAAEVLGKSRLFRAGLRSTRLALELVTGLSALLIGLATALGSALQGRALKRLRRLSG